MNIVNDTPDVLLSIIIAVAFGSGLIGGILLCLAVKIEVKKGTRWLKDIVKPRLP